MRNKYCLFTNDVEDHSIWLNSLRLETGKKVLNEGMPLLLDIYEKYNIKSTFFFTGYIAKEFPQVVRMILKYGHEVGSHGYSHNINNAFDKLTLAKQIEHLKISKDLLEDISGNEVISFRAPALRVNNDTVIALNESGFKIDSSVASQRFDLFMSYGGLNKLRWLTAPRLPYKTAKDSLFRKGYGNIVEIPISATIMPYIGTTMRMFPSFTNIQKRLLNFENKINNKPIVFLIHPNELIDESDEKRIVNRRARNLISYFIRDLLRSSLKTKNLGKQAIKLYEDEIKYFYELNYKFITLREYCIIEKLI